MAKPVSTAHRFQCSMPLSQENCLISEKLPLCFVVKSDLSIHHSRYIAFQLETLPPSLLTTRRVPGIIHESIRLVDLQARHRPMYLTLNSTTKSSPSIPSSLIYNPDIGQCTLLSNQQLSHHPASPPPIYKPDIGQCTLLSNQQLSHHPAIPSPYLQPRHRLVYLTLRPTTKPSPSNTDIARCILLSDLQPRHHTMHPSLSTITQTSPSAPSSLIQYLNISQCTLLPIYTPDIIQSTFCFEL